MLSNLQERYACYEFLYERALKEKNPIARDAAMRSFEAFKKFVRREDRRAWILEQQIQEGEKFAAACLPTEKEMLEGLQVA
jgi:hypothetical protein